MKVYIKSCKWHISGTNSHCKLNFKGQQSLLLHKSNKKFVGVVSCKVLSTDFCGFYLTELWVDFLNDCLRP